MIELRDIEFAYPAGVFRLRIQKLHIARRELAACIGPSGSGKTTLVNLIAGIAVPARGEVRLGGGVISSLGDDRRRARRIAEIGMVFQEFELLPYLSALDNILLPFFITSALTPSAKIRERAIVLARDMGIEHVLARRPRHLSQGERQRVAISRALVTQPAVVLCDEPTGNLDPVTAARMLDLLFEQVRARGATLLMVTHDHALLERFERVIDMRAIGAEVGR